MEDKVIGVSEIDTKIENLKMEFSKIAREVEALAQQANEKRTRLVEIQGSLKTLEEMKKK